MAAGKLVPGMEADWATVDDVRAIVDRAISGSEDAPNVVQTAASGVTDAAGAARLDVYRVRPGQRFLLTRMIVTAAGSTAGAPYTSAGAYLEVLRNDVVVDFASLAAAPGLPFRLTSGKDGAAVFEQGDALCVRLVGGPVSASIVAHIRGLGYGAGE